MESGGDEGKVPTTFVAGLLYSTPLYGCPNLGSSRTGNRYRRYLNMRLGEGTGAALTLYLLDSSLRILSEMATFADAGVSNKNT